MGEKIRYILILGQVDSGKTSFLEACSLELIRRKESRGITQSFNFRRVGDFVFIDTPGHLSFSQNREKGERIADVAMLFTDWRKTGEIDREFLTLRIPTVIIMTKVDTVPGFSSEFASLKDFMKSEKSTEWKVEMELAKEKIFSNLVDGESKFKRENLKILPLSNTALFGLKEILELLRKSEVREKSSLMLEESVGEGGIREIIEFMDTDRAGMVPLRTVWECGEIRMKVVRISSELSSGEIGEEQGVVVICSSNNKRSALLKELSKVGIPVRKDYVSSTVTKEARMIAQERNGLYSGIICCFNLRRGQGGILSDNIYDLVDKTQKIIETRRTELKKKEERDEAITSELQLIDRKHVFRTKNPLICGFICIRGEVSVGDNIGFEGRVGRVTAIKKDGKESRILRKGERGSLEIRGMEFKEAMLCSQFKRIYTKEEAKELRNK